MTMAAAAYNPKDVGYDVEFVDKHVKEEDLTCTICHLILRSPVQADDCGHRFCQKCIEKHHQRRYLNPTLKDQSQGPE